MTAAGPDPSAETVRLLPADTFTQQTRAEWIEIAYLVIGKDYVGMEGEEIFAAECAAEVVDALLAHLAAQQARPMPGGGGQ